MLQIYYRSLVILLLLASPCLADETLPPTGTDATITDGATSCDDNAHGTLDEGADSPGGDWCTADNNNTNWTIAVSFDTPSGTLDTSSDAQSMEIYAQAFDEGQSGDPQIRIDVHDGTNCADLHETGTETTLTDAGYPAKITDNWTASGVSGSADVCAVIVCTKAGGGPGARNSCDIDAVEWEVVTAVAGSRRFISKIPGKIMWIEKDGERIDS